MFDRQSDDPIPLSLAARQIPNRKGKLGVNSCTIWRWALKDLKGHRLRTQFVGGIRMTTGRWLGEFFDAVTAAADGTLPSQPTTRQRKSAIQRAEKELADAGI